MKTGAAFPSKYLKAEDLAGRRATVTIDNVAMEAIAGGEDRKPVVYFSGKSKGLVLNRTNATTITEIAGTDEMDDWHGIPIILYATRVDFQGRRVDAIRVDAPPRSTKPAPTRRAQPEPTPEPESVEDFAGPEADDFDDPPF